MSKRNILKTANIRNARLCNSTENFGHNSVFNVEREDLGWDFVENGTLYGVSGGFFFMSATTFSPSLSRSTSFLGVDAGEYTKVVVKFKYKNFSKFYSASKGRIYFTTNSDPVFTEEKSAEFEVISDNEWHVYSIDMAPVFKWVGFITNLKIVFADGQGVNGDEIFVEYIRIQADNFTFCTENCNQTDVTVELYDSFDNQNIGTEPQNWSTISTFPGDRIISVERDSESLVNRVVTLVNSTASAGGPSIFRSLSEAVGIGNVSFRFRVTELEALFTIFSDALGTSAVAELRTDPGSGNLQYRQGLSTFTDFEVESPIEVNRWYQILIDFDLSRRSLIVYLDGTLIGTIPYIFAEPVRSIRFTNQGNIVSTVSVDDVMIIKILNSDNFCPGIGRRGSIVGTSVLFDKLDIEEGVNDTLIVNINNYGDVEFTFPPSKGLTREEVRVLLERELSSIDQGGYPYCEVSYDYSTASYRIQSGTYGFDSTVQVIGGTLANTLGFTDSLGNPSYETISGRPHAVGFEFSNTYVAKSLHLSDLVNVGGSVGLLHNPTSPVTKIGTEFAGTTSRLNKLSGVGKTFVDFYHRATEEGTITEVEFHGQLPRDAVAKYTTNFASVLGNRVDLNEGRLNLYELHEGDLIEIDDVGYEGNGSYVITRVENNEGAVYIDTSLPLGSNLTVTVQTVGKVKHLRPDHKGRLTLVNEVVLGEEILGQLYSRVPDTYKIPVNWYVHKGDMIGIYNATGIYVGNDINRKAEAMYLAYDGDLVGSNVEVGVPVGNGIKGIGLLGKNTKTQDRAVYDISFEEAESIEYLDIDGELYPELRDYNLATAIDQGFSLQVTVTGTHIHKVFNTLTSDFLYIPHQNIAYNIEALTDGVSHSFNGFLGAFEQNIEGAAYFYVSGDGEFTPTDPADQDAIEFPVGGNLVHEEIQEYYNDEVVFNFNWNVPKEVYKYKMFFKEYPNVDNYSMEWLKKPNRTYDGSSIGYERIGLGNDSEFSLVRLDQLTLTSDQIEEAQEFIKHFQKVFDANIDSSNPGAGGTRLTYERNPFTVLEKQFTPVTTKAMRWICGSHRSTKISEVELYSYTSSASSLSESLELFFSGDGVEFEKADVTEVGPNKVRFDIGIPVKHMRIVVTPSTLMELYNISADSSDSLIKYSDETKEKSIDSLDIDIEKGVLSEAKKLRITNLDCFTSSAEVSVETEEISDTIILKSNLRSEDEVLYPEVGPNGITYFDSNSNLRITDNIAINSKLYRLKNLAANAPFYEATKFETESDYFKNGVDFGKWIGHFQNFPGYSAGDLFSPDGVIDYGNTTPGFNMESGTFPPDSPANPEPNKPASAELRSKWNVTGSFSSFIEGRIDPTGTNAAPRSTILGIVDSTGRRISIEKEVIQWRDHSPQPDKEWSNFTIKDSMTGTVESFRSFQTTPNPTFGSRDYESPFVVKMTREFEGSEEKFTFSYIDSVNGSGELEWDGEDFYTYINAVPLVEPVKMYVQNYWRIQPYFPGGIDGTLTGTPHNRILSFNFSGFSSYSNSDISFGVKRFCGSNGEVNKDNKQNISSLDGIRAIAVDLGKRYSLDTLINYTDAGNPLWNPNLVEFSRSEVSNPNLVSWGNSNITNVRWVLFKEIPVPTTSSGSEVTYLDTLRIFPDITQNAPGRLDNSEWEQIVDVLTDGDSSTFLTQIESPIFAIDLGERFEIKDYFLLDRRGEEFSGRPYFEGWDTNAWHTYAATGLDDPKKVNWNGWQEHSQGNKVPRKSRWHAFKNDTFNVSNGSSNPRYAATFKASTLGFTSSGTGEYSDVVDFTEFSQWFDTPYREETVESEITLDLVETVGLLYDTTPLSSIQGIESGEKYFLFDNDLETYASMTQVEGEDVYAWRVFGTPSGTILDDSIVVSGIVLSGTGEIVESQEVILEGVEVTAFEVAMGDNSIGFPDRITIQTLIGTDPTLDISWITLDSENGLVSYEEDEDGFASYVFNGGETYRYSLNSPTTISGFRVLFQDIEYGDEQELRNISISKVNAIRSEDGQTDPILEVSNDVLIREGGRRSLKLTYRSGNSQSATRTLGGSARLTLDPYWSIQDYLKFFLKIDNVEELDLENSFIKIGQDQDFHYAWPLSALQGDLSSVELNSYRLKFKEAPIQGIPGISINSRDRSDLESKVNFKEGPIQFVEFELKPKGTASQDIIVWLDNFSIDREKFELPGQFGNSLYLNNSELLHYPLANFDIRKGYFEAIVTPDWDTNANTTITKWEAFTIFSAVNDLDESFSCVYAPFNMGLIFTIGTQDRRYNLTVGKLNNLKRYVPFKIGVAWDSKGELIEDNSQASLKVWVNDQPVSEFEVKWEITQTKNTYFFIGSKAPETDLALNTPIEFPTTNPGKISPDIQSVTGGIENVLLNREPVRIDFKDIQTLKDKIEVSVDGITYFKGSSEDLPLIFSDLESGESFDLWVRTNFPKDTKNMSRTAYLRTRWRRS